MYVGRSLSTCLTPFRWRVWVLLFPTPFSNATQFLYYHTHSSVFSEYFIEYCVSYIWHIVSIWRKWCQNLSLWNNVHVGGAPQPCLISIEGNLDNVLRNLMILEYWIINYNFPETAYLLLYTGQRSQNHWVHDVENN